jgi:N-acetylmuramoyl-L-alanine amidase
MKFKKIMAALLIAATVAGTVGFQKVDAASKKTYTVAIDAGHQSKGNYKTEPVGPGAKTRKAKVSSGTRGVATKVSESRLNLDIAKKLEKELKKRGYKVYMVRRKQKVNISNMQRAKRVNKSGADIYIRLHADAAGSGVKGASALYPSKKNRYVKRLSKKSRKLSKCILDKYCKSTGFRKRGLFKRDDLTGTNWSKVPVTLIEMGFMTNRSEDRKMQKKSYQTKMVKGIANGVDQYFK